MEKERKFMIVGLLMTISCSHFVLCFLLINLMTSELVMQLWPDVMSWRNLFLKIGFALAKKVG